MHFYFLLLLQICLLNKITASKSWKHQPRIFTISENGLFELDGETFFIHAGEIHYFRIARCKWQDRLKNLKQVGFNTVSTPIEWATHEPKPEKYTWTGNADVFEFIDLAWALGLFVIVKAGPFIDADRDLGGIPRWLLSKNLSLLENISAEYTPEYKYYATRYLEILLPKIKEKTLRNGGPVIMVQIDNSLGENEFCGNHTWLFDIFSTRLGRDTIFLTMDRNVEENLKCGKIEGAMQGFRTSPLEYAVSFGGSFEKLFELAKTLNGGFVEFRAGMAWRWGAKRHVFEEAESEKLLVDLIANNVSFVFYMSIGGTNFERPAPGIVTSFERGALVEESGICTKRCSRVQSLLGAEDEITEIEERAFYDRPEFGWMGSLLEPEIRQALGLVPIEGPVPLAFHELDPDAEVVLYESFFPNNLSLNNNLEIHSLGVRDRAQVFLGNKLVGMLSSERHTIKLEAHLEIETGGGQNLLQILVESDGYIAQPRLTERKGLLGPVYLGSTALRKWIMWPFVFNQLEGLQKRFGALVTRREPRKLKAGTASLYRATFLVHRNNVTIKAPLDSFLDVSSLGRGLMFLNDLPLGKFNSLQGPQHSLYVPSCFLKPFPFANHLTVVQFQRRLPKPKLKHLKDSRKFSLRRNYNLSSASRHLSFLHFIMYFIIASLE